MFENEYRNTSIPECSETRNLWLDMRTVWHANVTNLQYLNVLLFGYQGSNTQEILTSKDKYG